jgi:type I restriction enzyme S subunit
MKVNYISTALDNISMTAVFNSSAKLIDPGAILIVVRGMILDHSVP